MRKRKQHKIDLRQRADKIAEFSDSIQNFVKIAKCG
jgi:hypothetical protein